MGWPGFLPPSSSPPNTIRCATRVTGYAQKLADADVPVKHLPIKGATHAFFSFTGSVQLSRDVLNQLGDAVAMAFND